VEYLVTMTTRVPDGTTEAEVLDVRIREEAHSAELAGQGQLIRLWRPPLAPGEWRSLGLFAAADGDALEQVLASMPLRVWRTDEVTPLGPHQNDPGMPSSKEVAEFFTTFTIAPAAGTPAEAVDDARAREAVRARELAVAGKLRRLWALPGEGRNLGLWQAFDGAEMLQIVKTLPLDPYMTTEITPLTAHPSDPG